ncbi:UDP-N-acetylglucosamine 2-epimerase [Micromonosporaceae bacterium Da 78-11]
MSLPEVHLVGGSRAEAVRLAPVALAMRDQGRLTPILLAAGPEPAAVAETLAVFGLTAEITLPAQTEPTEVMRGLDELWSVRTPGAVLVTGDTVTGLGAGLAAFWRRIPMVHLEAGRRSGELASSTLAEANPRLLTQVATVHLAATPLAAMNLLDERVAGGDVLLTGATMVDASMSLAWPATDSGSRLVVVSSDGFGAAIQELTARHPRLEVITVGRLSYAQRWRLLAQAYLVVTDDDELQEEALGFGVPALVPCAATEQVESLHAGCAKLIGDDPATILAEVAELLDSRARRDSMTACGNPYGDGLAAARAAQATAALLGHGIFPEPMPAQRLAVK